MGGREGEDDGLWEQISGKKWVKERSIFHGPITLIWHSQIKRALWIIRYNTTRHYYLSQFLKIFYHFLPALLLDTYLKMTSKEPKLLKIYRKVNKFSEVLDFFTNNEWDFEDKNMKRLCNVYVAHVHITMTNSICKSNSFSECHSMTRSSFNATSTRLSGGTFSVRL